GQDSWAKKTLATMSLEEKIGQLIMIAAYSNKGEEHIQYTKTLIDQYHIGGVIMMQGSPYLQIKALNTLQKDCKIPLLIAQDAEWGVGMRLDSVPLFPRNMTLGAIQNDLLLYEMGVQIAKQCRAVGVQVNFAPVIDVNDNPANPVIGDRSFGEDKYNVARKGGMIAKGMQSENIIPCGKHFPGHGNTDTDSHLDLPIIRYDRNVLDTIHLLPFKTLIQHGLPAIMVAHLYIPALDSTPNRASTLSPKVVNQLLRQELGFKGLIFTDALNMQGVAKFYPPGEADVHALLAGNDMLLFSGNVPKTVEKIKQALNKGEITLQELDEHVLRILQAKEWCGLHKGLFPKNPTGVTQMLNSSEIKNLIRRLYEASVTVVKNEFNILPIKELKKHNVGHICISNAASGVNTIATFVQTLNRYAAVKHVFANKKSDLVSIAKQEFQKQDVVIVTIKDITKKASENFGISVLVDDLIQYLQSQGKIVVTCVFGTPYSLKNFECAHSLVCLYEDNYYTRKAAAEVIVGAIKADGKLPVSSGTFKAGQGCTISALHRIRFDENQEMCINTDSLKKIEKIVEQSIKERIFPGCQVMMVKEGIVIYQKSFGRLTYDSTSKKVHDDSTIYDLASVTKVAATTLAAMRLWEQGKLDLQKKIKDYLPEFDSTNKANITIEQLLTHTSGLPSVLFYYRKPEFRNTNCQYTDTYTCMLTDSSHFYVAPHIFMKDRYRKVIIEYLKKCRVRPPRRLIYSDVNMTFMQLIIERITQKPLDVYVKENFYEPLQLRHTGFNPMLDTNLSKHDIAPTENDTLWRKQQIWGTVHDQTAAIFGGVCGNAGLFSNAHDLAVIGQMLLNGGVYGGVRFFAPQTIDYFTRRVYPNIRRGLGWDKPENTKIKAPVGSFASMQTYGHLGYTGTAFWIDPKEKLVFVFLSNRIYPTVNDKRINKEAIRQKIMSIAYKVEVE
ncbi:MAG: glycoside hydrolase family 3 N-terminal domain-containing protein, partial [Bacteroidia bacterium]|nr:glycoside hydrolase family 3 N-terminal domain-containing protein [Bacteroidia bacterium]